MLGKRLAQLGREDNPLPGSTLAAKDLIERRCGQECVGVLLQLRERCRIEQVLLLGGQGAELGAMPRQDRWPMLAGE